MKIRELLANTLQTVMAQQLILRSPQPVYGNKNDFYKYLLDMEREESWLQLSNLFKNAEIEATAETLAPFVKFLEMRWRRIARIYELTYYRNYKDPLTLVCESLADELKLGHRLELLMPGVNFDNDNIVDKNEKGVTITELDLQLEATHIKQSYMRAGAKIGFLTQEKNIERAVKFQLSPEAILQAQKEGLESAKLEKLQLHHFVLDNDDTVIHVLDCLSDAQLDGKLKHTNKRFKYKDSFLSAKEGSKAIYHSQEARLLFEAVGDFWIKRTQSFSIGGHINRLIQGVIANGELKGIRYGATGEMPGWNLNESVRDFYVFTKLLTPEDLEYLYSRNSTNFEYRSFKYYWFRLLQGYSYLLSDAELLEIHDYMEYCKQVETAELEATAIPMLVELTEAQIIPVAQLVVEDDNDTKIDSESSDGTLSDDNETSDDENEEQAAIVVQPAIAVVEYDAPNAETPCIEVISSYFEDVLLSNFELYYRVPECYAELEEESLLDVKNQFERIRQNFKESIHTKILTEAEPHAIDGLPKLKMPWSRTTNDSHKLKFLFHSLINSPKRLVRLVNQFPEPFHQWILPRFGQGCLKQAINSAPALIYVLENLAHNPRNLVLKLVKKFYGNAHFRKIVNTYEALCSLMQAQACMQHYFLKELGKTHLRYIIDTKESLDNLKTILTKENYDYLVNTQLMSDHISRLVTASTKARRGLTMGIGINLANEFNHVANTSLGLFGGRGKKRVSSSVFSFEFAEDPNKRVRSLDGEEERKEFSPIRPVTPASR
jgi:hypothetical protein